jgi:predicted metallo-beta-lactamase superfamily hydrolase
MNDMTSFGDNDDTTYNELQGDIYEFNDIKRLLIKKDATIKRLKYRGRKYLKKLNQKRANIIINKAMITRLSTTLAEYAQAIEQLANGTENGGIIMRDMKKKWPNKILHDNERYIQDPWNGPDSLYLRYALAALLEEQTNFFAVQSSSENQEPESSDFTEDFSEPEGYLSPDQGDESVET